MPYYKVVEESGTKELKHYSHPQKDKAISASNVSYDSSNSHLSATNVQGAIDEINNECFRSRSSANETSADNIVKPGFYIVNPNRTTSGLPVSGVYGYLTVLTSSMVNNKQDLLQRFELLGSSSSVIYERKCSWDSSTSSYIWYPWKTFLPSGQVIAHHEVSDTASQAYSVGSYLTRGEQLKKVTSEIASGGTISSSNTSNTTVGNELTQINSNLSDNTSKLKVLVNMNRLTKLRCGVMSAYFQFNASLQVLEFFAQIEPNIWLLIQFRTTTISYLVSTDNKQTWTKYWEK